MKKSRYSDEQVVRILREALSAILAPSGISWMKARETFEHEKNRVHITPVIQSIKKWSNDTIRPAKSIQSQPMRDDLK
jgi:hypothetical protein